MSRTFDAEVTVYLRVTVNDENVIDRVVNNEDNWQGTYYKMADAVEVVDMLAYNYVVNGREINRLDGWADLPPNAVTYYETGSDTTVTET